MAKSKRRVAVARRQGPAHFVDPNAHEVDGAGHVGPAFEAEDGSCPLGPAPSIMRDSDGDGSVVQVATDFEAVTVPCPLGTPPSTMRVQLCDGDGSEANGHVAPSTHEVGHPQAMEVAPGHKLLEVVPVEDCTIGSDEEIIGEEQLDLNFSDDDCDSPQGTEIIPAPIVSPPGIISKTVHSPQQREMPQAPSTGRQVPAPPSGSGNPIPGPNNSKWRDILFSNRVIPSCTKLQNYALNHLSKSCVISHDDIMSKFEVWNYCAVGYISGKSTGFKALNSIIANVWKTEATLTIHETGWLIYRFKSEEDKLAVLRGGPYLVYGRPLVLRPMTKFFDFSCEEMSRVPVWVKFPSLPLCCWSPICLSKIASVIGKPIQCDQLTSNLSRMSYARVLVEIDLLEELRHTVEIALPDGPTLHQKVVYKTLPKYCNFCHVLGHSRLLCSKAAASTNKVHCSQPQSQDDVDRENVFNRLGPQPSLVSSPPPMHGQPHGTINQPDAMSSPPPMHGQPHGNINHQDAVSSPPPLHGQPHGNNNQQDAEDISTPEGALDNSAGWIKVNSRKASKLRKGKEVVGSGRVSHSMDTGQHPPLSPRPNLLSAIPCDELAQDRPPTAPLIIPCEGEDHSTAPAPGQPPPLPSLLCAFPCDGRPPTAPLIIPCEGTDHITAPASGTIIGAGNLVNVYPVEVADQCGVRTRNQKQRSRGGREFPSTAHP